MSFTLGRTRLISYDGYYYLFCVTVNIPRLDSPIQEDEKLDCHLLFFKSKGDDKKRVPEIQFCKSIIL